LGFSDLTTLQIFLWQRRNWITFYGPMVAAGLNAGPGARRGYDESSFLQAVGRTEGGWKLRLRGEAVLAGQSMGRVLGGCMTLLEATIGTPWELDTEDSILVLRRSRHEALSGGSRPDAFETSPVNLKACADCAGRLSGK